MTSTTTTGAPQFARAPYRRGRETRFEQIAIAADDRIDALLPGERDEVVVVRISRGRRAVARIIDDSRVTLDALDVLAHSALVYVAPELRSA